MNTIDRTTIFMAWITIIVFVRRTHMDVTLTGLDEAALFLALFLMVIWIPIGWLFDKVRLPVLETLRDTEAER